MKLLFNNFLIIDNSGNLEYYNDNDDNPDTVDLSSDEIFHLTLSRVYEEDDPIYLDYRDVHHFIKRVNDETICAIGIRINSDPGFYCREIIIDYLKNVEIEGILNHEFTEPDYIHQLTEQIVEKLIQHTYNQYKTTSYTITKNKEQVSQHDY